MRNRNNRVSVLLFLPLNLLCLLLCSAELAHAGHIARCGVAMRQSVPMMSMNNRDDDVEQTEYGDIMIKTCNCHSIQSRDRGTIRIEINIRSCRYNKHPCLTCDMSGYSKTTSSTTQDNFLLSDSTLFLFFSAVRVISDNDSPKRF